MTVCARLSCYDIIKIKGKSITILNMKILCKFLTIYLHRVNVRFATFNVIRLISSFFQNVNDMQRHRT